MPSKHAVKERAWGTRYDTLKSSPSSPTVQLATKANPHSPISTQDGSNVVADDKSTAANPPSSATSKAERPNDSSIFVGSLPTSIDLPELNHLLAVHFSVYSQVKDIKAVRDNNKGSVCAFIQCEDPEAASRLLKTLQESPPRPFQGRFLRFEFARASRALVIAYRTPPQYAYPNSGFDDAVERDALRLNAGGDLPTAMRIFRPRNSKYPTILYDSEATAFDAKTSAPAASPEMAYTPVVDDALNGSGVLIDPLDYTAEALKKLALSFGPIEHFGPFVPNKESTSNADESSRPIRPFGDLPRSPGMEAGAWEIKWDRREDCMIASITLRRVPHLVVSWAHHVNSDGMPETRFGSPSASPGHLYPSTSRARNLSRPHIASGDYQRFGEPHGQFSPNFMPTSGSLRLGMSPFSDGARSPNFRNWSPTCSSPNMRGPSSPLATRDSAPADMFSPDTTVTPELNEVEFPPLHNGRVSARVRKGPKPLSLPWVPQESHRGEVDRQSVVSTSPSSSLSVQLSTPCGARSGPSPPNNDGDDKSVSQPPSSPAANDIDTDAEDFEQDQGQELTVPPTPEFTTSSITPITPKTGNSYPLTPQSVSSGDHAKSPDAYHMTPKRAGRFMGRDNDADREREVDPLSIFVGNLETNGPNGWTEEKLRSVFEKYGDIEDLRLYDQAQKAVAFAFIRYEDAESCPQAIAAEHQKLYDGRAIRVQLRELKSHMHRTPFKIIRARGRLRNFHEDSPNHHGGNIDFHDQAQDEFVSGYSPRSFRGRPMSYQESRHHMHRTPADAPHLNMKNEATEVVPHPVFASINQKPASVQEDMHSNASTWRPPMYHGEGHPEHSAAGSSATSASVSPPPSSNSSHPPSVMNGMPPYPPMMMPPPWMHPAYYPHPYHLPYMPPYMGYPPPVPPYAAAAADNTGGEGQQAGWTGQGHVSKRTTPYGQNAPGDEQSQSQAYPGHGGTQPPIRAVGFEQTPAGMFIPMYPPDALNQYMSSQGNVQSQQQHSQTPPPQGPSASQQQPQQHAPSWPQYHGMPPTQMPTYPYPYPPHAHAGQTNVGAGQYPNMSGSWGPNMAPTTYPAHTQTSIQPAPPQYASVPPSTAATPMNASNSFYTPHLRTYSSSESGRNSGAPPRRGMGRGYGNRHGHVNGNRFGARLAPPGGGHVEASYSFVDGLPPSRSQMAGPSMRASGSYPNAFGM